MTNCINEKRLLPEEVEQLKPQAGRYMSQSEIDERMIGFADYMQNERYIQDRRAGKEMTWQEHLDFFKQKYYQEN